jgi:uncharacterized protein
MHRLQTRHFAGITLFMFTFGVLAPSAMSGPAPALAAATPKSTVRLTGGEKCFPETGKCLRGVFLGFWQGKGGVPQFGYPITDELEEDGRTVQYTQRARFEFHPENRDTPSEVELSLLGNSLAAGNSDAAFAAVQETAGTTFFTETGHALQEPFNTYWRTQGGLQVFGYPISESFNEVSPTDGNVYRVQYFERNRLEYHPDAGEADRIQLGLLGTEFYKRIYGDAPPPAPNPEPISMHALQQMTRWGNDLKIVRTVDETSEYTQYSITYRSGNLKITGQMFVPVGDGPFPVMIMNHGFLTTDVYTSGMDSHRESPFVAANGFVAIHPDFRNYAGSDVDEDADVNLTAFGWAEDSLNLVDAVKHSDLAFLDKTRIGYWGHSNGGQVSMMALVAQQEPDIKAFVLFAPTSPNYVDNFNRWTRPRAGSQVAAIKARHGLPEDNPAFYEGLSVGPAFVEAKTKGPVLLFHGTADTNTPFAWSETSAALMADAGIDITFVPVAGENHLFSDNAWSGGVASRFLAFINKYVKNAQ